MTTIDAYLNQTATHEAVSGFSGEGGDPTYAAGVNIACRLVLKTVTRFGETGPVGVADGVLYIKADQAAAERDRFTVDSVVYRTVETKEPRGLGGAVHHKTAMVRRERT